MAGDPVLVPRRLVEAMARAVSGARARAQHAGVPFAPELAAILAGLDQLLQPVPAVAEAGTGPRKSTANGPTFLVGEVACRTGASPSAVRRAARRGTLTGTHQDGQWTFTEQAIERWETALATATARRKAETDRQDQAEGTLRADLDQTSAALADLETQLHAAEAERDAAEVMVELADGGIREYQARERYDQAATAVTALLPRIAPLRERERRLRGYLAPMEARRTELSRARAKVAALADLPKLADQLAALADQLRNLDSYRPGHTGVEVPSLLRRIRHWTVPDRHSLSGRSDRDQVAALLRYRDKLTARIAELEAQQP